MLSERFNVSNLKDLLLPPNTWHPHPKFNDRSAWKISHKAFRQAHIARGGKAAQYEWPVAPATFFLDYQRTGNRTRWQTQVRDARRHALADLAVAECIEGEGRFIDNIIDGIWTTCEESFWGVPAHLSRQKAGVGLPDVTEPIVDLFAAEAASLLAWTLYLFEKQFDEISTLIGDRIRLEIDRRILTPCLEREFSWMGFNNKGRRVNNWNPWIISNWLTCSLLIEPDEDRRAALVSRALQALDNFIDPYPSDGGCDEGPGYWGHAGGALFDCLEILFSATEGGIDVYDEPLIQEIGRFPYRTQIADRYFVNFADAAARIDMPASLIFGYGKRIGDKDLMALGAWAAQQQKLTEKGLGDSLGRQLRAFEMLDELFGAEGNQPLPASAWLPEIELFVARDGEGSSEGFFVAGKGGHNAESHNHNDVGHFIVYLDGRPLIVDIGVEDYTSKTFGPDRYDIWTMNSSHHSLPTINGCQQAPGPEFKARNTSFFCDNETVRFNCDIASAYPENAGVKSWNRKILFQRRKRVTVTDTFELSRDDGIEMSIMTPCSVRIDGNVIHLDETTLDDGGKSASARLTFDAEAFDVRLDNYPLAEVHFKRGNPWGETLTRIVFAARNPKLKDQWEWIIEK